MPDFHKQSPAAPLEPLSTDSSDPLIDQVVDKPPPNAPSGEYSEAMARAVEKTVGAVLGLSWIDLLAAVVERSGGTDTAGNPLDWSRLQLRRNLLCLALATIPPVGDHTATMWVAQAVSEPNLVGGPLYYIGWGCGSLAAVFISQAAPSFVGLAGQVLWSFVRLIGRGGYKALRSPYGWLAYRPVLFATGAGVLVAYTPAILRFLTGAS